MLMKRLSAGIHQSSQQLRACPAEITRLILMLFLLPLPTLVNLSIPFAAGILRLE
jgi:hypothetical protein